MVKNIILDIGGIILDDSPENIYSIFKKDMTNINRKVYGENFKKCLLGELSFLNYLKSFENDKDYKDIKVLLDPSYQNIINPLMIDNFDYISKLKDKGYHLYLLSNITKETLQYFESIIDVDKYFDGAVYSCEVGMIKPDKSIFELIINKYNLDLNETIFFDDRKRNIDASCEVGINGILFKEIEDIERNI